MNIRTATPLDCVQVGLRLRDEDRGEIFASCGDCEVIDVLAAQIEADSDAQAVYYDGRPAALVGCANGIPWMLGTDELTKHPRMTIALARGYVDHWLSLYGRLHNVIWSGSERNLAFVRFLGFTVEPAEDEFHEFHMEAA